MHVHRKLRIAGFALAALTGASCTDRPAAPIDVPQKVVGIPLDWQTVTNPSPLYEIGVSNVEWHAGTSSVYLTGPKFVTDDFGYLIQYVRPDNYKGKRLRLSAWVKGQDLAGPIAGIWMKVDGAGAVLGYDNMAARPETGTSQWHEVSIVLDIPSDALGILIGAMRRGGGTLFIDDVKLEVVGNEVPSTNLYAAPIANNIDPSITASLYLNAPPAPANAGFERKP